MKKISLAALSTIIAVIFFGSCTKTDDLQVAGTETSEYLSKNFPSKLGAVITMDNLGTGNSILLFKRYPSGNLQKAGTFPTDGLGLGKGLGSQGALAATEKFLFACNAGSNDITVFQIDDDGFTWIEKVSSHGTTPISLTVFGDWLYVLNAGASGNISGFRIQPDGHLLFLEGSIQSLSTNASDPAQILFNSTGNQLVVTEKATSIIGTYPVDANGIAGQGQFTPSAGATPFGFDFGINNQLVVSNAEGGDPNASTVSSYKLSTTGGLSVIEGPVPITETAACWVDFDPVLNFGYITNTESGTVTGIAINDAGEISLLNASGTTATPGGSPLDVGLTKTSEFLYILNPDQHAINGFKVNPSDGSLTSIGNEDGGGIAFSSAGIIVR